MLKLFQHYLIHFVIGFKWCNKRKLLQYKYKFDVSSHGKNVTKGRVKQNSKGYYSVFEEISIKFQSEDQIYFHEL
jgi:hypothetical protein